MRSGLQPVRKEPMILEMNDKKMDGPPVGLGREFLVFVRQNKKLWLVPLVLLAILVAVGVLLAQSGALAPFMYTPS